MHAPEITLVIITVTFQPALQINFKRNTISSQFYFYAYGVLLITRWLGVGFSTLQWGLGLSLVFSLRVRRPNRNVLAESK